MHPSISSFPNREFYHNQIMDGPNVLDKSYEKHYLPGPMFGAYSFISISNGKEIYDDLGHSRKNMDEIAVILEILRSLFGGMFNYIYKLKIFLMFGRWQPINCCSRSIYNLYNHCIIGNVFWISTSYLKFLMIFIHHIYLRNCTIALSFFLIINKIMHILDLILIFAYPRPYLKNYWHQVHEC